MRNERILRRLVGAWLELALVPVAAGSQAPTPAPVGEWPMAAGNYESTRYSALDAIDTKNVGKLAVAFTFDTGVDKGQEAAPIVVGDTMYVVSPYPNRVFALDLGANGKLKWTYAPEQSSAAPGVACCDVVNRGAAYADGKLFFNTLDGSTIALDPATGKPLWRTPLADIRLGETITMAPLVVRGKVLVGDSGGEFGVRGWLAALDANDGHVVWKAFHTGPDADVLIGDGFKPHYAADRGKDLGVKSWPPLAWRIGGGTMWGWISYDAELNLIYYGTGNPGPWNAAQRPGDNKWTAGIFARDPDTGQARWFYQFSPHDLFDYDAVNENVLLDLPVGKDAATRKVIVRPERNGFIYVIDRTTGEVLSADAYTHVTTIKGVDLSTGLPKYDPDHWPKPGRTTRGICPASPGAKDWNPSAWSPQTALLYIPHINLCMDMVPGEVSYVAGTPYVGTEQTMYPGPGGNRGVMTAWDPAKRRPAWEVKEDLPVWSGALATAGGLVFYGTMDGIFKALDAKTGATLWSYKTDSGIIGQPVSYRGPDGRQYVAVLSGVGGWAGSIIVGKMDRRDVSGASGFVGVTRDLPDKTGTGGKLYVFALPQ